MYNINNQLLQRMWMYYFNFSFDKNRTRQNRQASKQTDKAQISLKFVWINKV